MQCARDIVSSMRNRESHRKIYICLHNPLNVIVSIIETGSSFQYASMNLNQFSV